MHKLGRTLLIFLMLGNCLFAIGQDQVSENYFITLSNDTIVSNISISNSKYSPVEIITSSRGETLVLSPKNILGFSYNGKKFISAAILREISPYLSNTHELLYLEDTVFLELIIDGEKKLLQYQDTTGKILFYIPDENKDFEWLVHKRYQVNFNGKNQLRDNNNYIGQLIIYLSDCSNINMIASATEYNKESLSELFEYYYGCTNTDPEYKNDKENFLTEIYALVGINLTNISITGSGNEYVTAPVFPWSVRFSGGIGVNVALPKILGMWSFNNELLYSSYSTSAEYREELSLSTYEITKTRIGASGLKINSMFRGHMPVNYATVFLDIGLSNTFNLSNTNQLIKTTYTANGSSETQGVALQDIKMYNFGFMVGVGVSVKQFSGFLRYELGSGITTQNDIDSKINNIYLFITYRFLDFK
jgi:hypothetical protein